MKRFTCACGQPVFFDSTQCERCGGQLGYAPDPGQMLRLSGPGQTGGQQAAARVEGYRPCANGQEHGVCNWLVSRAEGIDLCLACRTNRTIPDLRRPGNRERWGRLEAAKRRMLYSLLSLGLPLQHRGEQPEWGLAFDFLEDRRSNPEAALEVVGTGHHAGVIVVNVMEADPVEQARARQRLHEQYRTLIGHMRHEIGHYYWDRLIRDSERLDAFRAAFGDERADYRAALDRYYTAGPPPDWPGRFISAYASAHPWEDWAETWAHYLHMTDTLETAASHGLGGALPVAEARPGGDFADRVNQWMALSVILNELNRSMGQDDPYPFVITPVQIRKLRFIHQTIAEAAGHDPR